MKKRLRRNAWRKRKSASDRKKKLPKRKERTRVRKANRKRKSKKPLWRRLRNRSWSGRSKRSKTRLLR